MSDTIRARSAQLQKFTGGLNNYWDQSAIDDNELAAIINFEFASNGSLQSRPPIYNQVNGSSAKIVTPVAGQPIDIIGTYVRQDGERFLVVTTNSKTWIYNVSTFAWTQITTFKASDCTQYLNKIVLASTTAGQGGYWESGTFTNTPTMPALGGIELLQTRFFGYGVQGTTTANILYWSNLSTSGLDGVSTSVWDWHNELGTYVGMYVEIGGGDGQWITALEQGYNDIILFRNASTYRFSFGDDPGATGVMQPMQQGIGAETKRSVTRFENAHLVLSGGILYRYQNYIFYPLNAQKVKMEVKSFSRRFEQAISIIGRRCYVWHSGATYVYNLDTETWSQWESETKVAHFTAVTRKNEQVEETLYFGISGATDAPATTDYALYRIEDKPYSITGSETFKCFIRTKVYDFATPVEWKRLYFWTADITSAKNVKTAVYPVDLPATPPVVTWGELSKDYPEETGYSTWDDLSYDGVGDPAYGTWDNLKKTDGQIATLVEITSDKPIRTEIKLNHALRFRRVYFELYLDCDGTASTSPVNIFNIIPMIGAKAKISKEIN
jgi:hypothetical protein